LPHIRLSSAKDFESVFELKRLAFRTYVEKVWGWQDKQQQGFVQQELDLGSVRLVQHDGVVVATLGWDDKLSHIDVFSFYVHPAEQSQGLGAVLLNETIPAKPLHLQVLKVNSRAKAFYVRHGFVQTDENDHHIIMKRR